MVLTVVFSVITGTSPEVFAHYGLTGEGIAKTVAEFLGN